MAHIVYTILNRYTLCSVFHNNTLFVSTRENAVIRPKA